VEREAAAAAGFYQTGDMKVPKPQIFTAANILDNRRSAGTVRIHRRLQKGRIRKDEARALVVGSRPGRSRRIGAMTNAPISMPCSNILERRAWDDELPPMAGRVRN
jgi:hypothetical protein